MSLLFSGCSSLSSIDKPVCVELSIDRGYCTTIISGTPIYVDNDQTLDGETWFESRIKMILVPPKTWAALKSYLIKNCKKSKKCNENIDSWMRSMKVIDEKIDGKAP